MFINELKNKFETLERTTVGSSFGGPPIQGRAPTFKFSPIVVWSINRIDEFPDPAKEHFLFLKNLMNASEFKYLMEALFRFSFCIELTNLSITSTKMKTRWVPGKIIKTRPHSFDNYEGDFAPGEDERAASYEQCLEILYKSVLLLRNSDRHIEVMKKLTKRNLRGIPYEAVFTYINSENLQVHIADNIRLAMLDDINWLIEARPLIRPVINKNSKGKNSKLISKISTKVYKTDRSQTGEVQTNRAKRWECLAIDFQHATLEECWSVERKLLNDLAHFEGFPIEVRERLIEKGLFGEQRTTVCPITFRPMHLGEILDGSTHGTSNFQVGHMTPLKLGGRHIGETVEWISGDGNRIQGSLSIEETRRILIEIYTAMEANGILKNLGTSVNLD